MVIYWHTHFHGQHTDKMHRPDPHTQRSAARESPEGRFTSAGNCHFARAVEGNKGGNKRDNKGNPNQYRVPRHVQHLTTYRKKAVMINLAGFVQLT